MYNNNNALTEEQIVSFLQNAVNSVESATQQDIEEFNLIKRLFAKNVPLMRRKYVAAYIVKQLAQGSGRPKFNKDRKERKDFNSDRPSYNSTYSRSEKSEERRGSKFEKPAHSERTERTDKTEKTERPERAPRVQIDPSVASTIFVGVGRNRRVFPRDLVGLLISVTGLERERIGDIRVLANYSFIQLYTEDCEKVIGLLNGYEYRGRKLSVSYSQKRDEEDGNESSVAANATDAPQAQKTIEESYEKIPDNVSNESHGIVEHSETDKIKEEQAVFASQQAKISSSDTTTVDTPYSETTDDGQVKSHFGTGAAY